MGKYFGTDGFRGEANNNLTADHAYKIGRFLGWYCGELKRRNGDDTPARIVIGKDTRRSSYMFEYTLVGGLVASGADAYLLHVTTTPSVAYVARTDEFDCGIMISASHNPYYDNGIKLINGNGEKMDEETISLVEAYLDGELEVFGQKFEEIPFAHTSKIGRTVDYVSGRNRYIGYSLEPVTFRYDERFFSELRQRFEGMEAVAGEEHVVSNTSPLSSSRIFTSSESLVYFHTIRQLAYGLPAFARQSGKSALDGGLCRSLHPSGRFVPYRFRTGLNCK